MAKRVEIEFISEGFEQILTGSGVQNVVYEQTNAICARANAANSRGGEGFESNVKLTHAYRSNRYVGFVGTTDRKSMIAESEDKALSGAVM
ncbi:MAG: hypothetical protein IKG23_00370 [Clostridia bacterium]|nr:hypothetical protein [Clostridia bacterium]